MDKEAAKKMVAELVEKFRLAEQSGVVKKYTEADTKKNFIEPLFSALGWPIDTDEVRMEETISGDRVDYGFYIDGRIQFYLEAKAVKADLNDEKFAHQAIKYSWNKGVAWAVLTDFEDVKIFNAQDINASLASKRFKTIHWDEYIDRFDELWLLSRAAWLDKLLDKEAEKSGKKLERVSVTSKLYEDLNEARALLSDAFLTWNKDLRANPVLLDEGVQKVLDRIIFIRVAEDRGIEPQTLRPLVREWSANWYDRQKRDKYLYQSMEEKFRELDAIYNSGIFEPHPSDRWVDEKNSLQDIAEKFYGKEGYYEYDFKAMPADVLGTVYEQYLGHKLAKAEKGGLGMDVAKDARKRKEQGIYYTPRFIVDYIVENALGPVLAKCDSFADLQKITVLDPACGSGSFLIKALELIYKKYEEFGRKGQFVKLQILSENIYGVDLDEQAVEIAQLNLLIAALETRMKMPNLDNIRNGNSLISGSDEGLRKYFGKDWRDKKPFNWAEEFTDVFKQGGFDVVIGNPPWGADITADYQYLSEYYPDSTKEKKDTYKTFIDKAIRLLKPDGNLGFIVPNSFLYQPSYEDIKKMVGQYSYEVINLGERIFSGVELPCCILMLEKGSKNTSSVIDLTQQNRVSLQNILSESNFDEHRKKEETRSKIVRKTALTFSDVFELKDAGIQYHRSGIGLSNKGGSDLYERIFCNKSENKFKKTRRTWYGKLMERYYISDETDELFNLDYKNILNKNESVSFTKEAFNEKEKILWRQTAASLLAVLDTDGRWFRNTIQCGYLNDNYKNKVNLLSALAIFNSKYIDYAYRRMVLETGRVFPQVKIGYLKSLPFVIPQKDRQQDLAKFATRMLDLNKKLHGETKDSEKWKKLKTEIERTDKEIDAEVYKLYDLTSEEIKIVESNK